MEFIKKVKDIISKLQAAGKAENEVSEIIKRAAEAATVTRKPDISQIPEIRIRADTENLQNALMRVGISAQEALSAFEALYKVRKLERSNNWRKYHGLPPKRRTGGKKKWKQKRK
ncbi:MAG: hypothetical protein Q4C58_03845 [Eubacteriales bacterium]|nr:hypothetical protein [Eubacteriales bacterium]